MVNPKYRSANVIILSILEAILRADREHILIKRGILKSHLIKACNLKVSTAEKYFNKMEEAGYIHSHMEPWGERQITIYQITLKGKERYEWFSQINSELE